MVQAFYDRRSWILNLRYFISYVSIYFLNLGAVAKRLCSGLQIRLERFDSALRLQEFLRLSKQLGGFFTFRKNNTFPQKGLTQTD